MIYDPLKLYPYQPIISRPKLAWPGGARVAVWVVPNIEHFGIHDFGHIEKPVPAPDVRNFARRDYGNRVGVWRMMDVMAKHGVPGTVALNSDAAIHYEEIIKASVDLGWELMGHGKSNSHHLSGQAREEEEAVVLEVRNVIEGCGQRMRGWLSPGLHETWHTLDILRRNGVDYVADWVHDDQPVRFANGICSIPYSFEINDLPLFNFSPVNADEFYLRVRDAFDTLYAEGAAQARVMCLALHPYLIGMPHRIGYLDKALAYIAGHDGVWFAKGHEIIDAFLAQQPSDS